MKVMKILICLIAIIFLSGCTNVKELTYDDIINTLSIENNNYNTFNKGYKFYTPKGLRVEELWSNSAVIDSEKATYYLYIDLISYYNKKDLNYTKKDDAIYSTTINYQNKKGYVEIKLWENNKYLIEIMYNYAKIEVMVDKDLINEALINSVNILKSVEYNDTIIENLLKEDRLNYTEEVFDMFEDAEDNSNILDYEDGNYYPNEDTEDNKDTDYVGR